MVSMVSATHRLFLRTLVAAVAVATSAVCPARAEKGAGQPMAAASPHGVWVFLGMALEKDHPYVISRESAGGGKSAPQGIGEASAPASRDELARRVRLFAPYFDGLPPVDDAEIDRMWKQVQSGKSVEHFLPVNLPVAHLAFGTAYLDTTVRAGAYRYRVEGGGLKSPVETRDVLFPADVRVPSVSGGSGSYDGHHINVRWKLPKGAQAGGLIVTRRVGLRGDFTRYRGPAGFTGSKNGTFAAVSDPGVESGNVYEYTVALVDAFANRGSPSEAVRVETFPANAVPTVVDLKAEDTGEARRVKISWKLTNDAYVRSISLQRGTNFDGPYDVVTNLPPGSTEYVDEVPDANEAVFYRIVVSGVRGDSRPSASIRALTTAGDAPLAPVDVDAAAAPGGVRVSWRGLGPHVVGYYVCRSEGPEGGWTQISSLVPPDTSRMSYTDSTRGTGRAFYYAVRAVGDTYALSPVSDFAAAAPPASHAPETPVNLRCVCEDGRVMLFWDDLSERDPALAGYAVFRRAAGEKEMKRVHGGGFAPKENYWTDSTTVAGGDYDYAVQAMNISKMKSAMSVPLAVHVPEAAPLPVPGSVRVTRVDKGLYVAWSRLDDSRVTGYRLYRTEAGGKRELVASPAAGTTSFVDSGARAGHVYTYALTAVYAGRGESEESAPVTARR